TGLFVKALSYWGTAFDLICKMFPGRNRHQIKNKFNREESKNPIRVKNALMNKKTLGLLSSLSLHNLTY
ncbi:hypothetical protein BKA69DRAFT_1026459, partial [Paraphysoderma sedebokerense]